MKQLTPRQGTKTYALFFASFHLLETTYTPPGDENLFYSRKPPAAGFRAKQLTPRQGTKT